MISPVRKTIAIPGIMLFRSLLVMCLLFTILYTTSLKIVTRLITKDQKEEGLDLPCMTLTNGPINNWSEVNITDFCNDFTTEFSKNGKGYVRR